MTSSDGVIPDRLDLAEGVTVHRFSRDASSYLLVHGGRSLLVNCHSHQLRKALEYRRLPLPELILHTHVKPTLCRQGTSFPEATIRVPAGLEELASDPTAWQARAVTVWDDPMAWGETMGAEPYGVAGCITRWPPEEPLTLGPSVKAGEVIDWQGLTIEAISLPYNGGPQALGFVLRSQGQVLAVFTGDLLCHDACLVNLYDLECSYGSIALKGLPQTLRDLAELDTELYLPASGPILLDGPRQARNLADKIMAYEASLRWQSGDFQAKPPPECPRLGNWHQVHDGVYQIAAPGNTIVLIDAQGRGLIVDPGPCDYDLPLEKRQHRFREDLALLEAEAGLREIDLILITHHHGDHYDLAPVVLDRYPGCRVAAWDLVARVVRAPWDYPYCCTLPWYNLGFEFIDVDDALALGEPYFWHEIRIDTVHLPGHSYCHAGYLLTFHGKRLAITGDTVQNQRGEASTLAFIMGNHSVPGDQGNLTAYRRLLEEEVDLNLGGHGSRFTNCRELYRESVRRIEYATPYLAALVPDGDLQRACLRPGFPRMDSFG